RRAPEDQPSELVHFHHRWDTRSGRGDHGRRRHRLDLLHALQHDLLEHARHADGHRRVHHPLLFHSHWSPFHRYDAHHARTRDDLVSYAALSLVSLRHQHDFRAWHAGSGHQPARPGRRTHVSRGHLRPEPWR